MAQATHDMMHAAAIDEFGGPITPHTLPVPEVGPDEILLTAGGDVADRALDAMRDGGRVAYPNGVAPVPRARPGIDVRSYESDATPEMIAKLDRIITEAPIDVHVARTLPLDRAADALRALDRHLLGKLALRPNYRL